MGSVSRSWSRVARRWPARVARAGLRHPRRKVLPGEEQTGDDYSSASAGQRSCTGCADDRTRGTGGTRSFLPVYDDMAWNSAAARRTRAIEGEDELPAAAVTGRHEHFAERGFRDGADRVPSSPSSVGKASMLDLGVREELLTCRPISRRLVLPPRRCATPARVVRADSAARQPCSAGPPTWRCASLASLRSIVHRRGVSAQRRHEHVRRGRGSNWLGGVALLQVNATWRRRRWSPRRC